MPGNPYAERVRVASLAIYPVKSTAPLDLESAEVEPWGLHGDRRWAVLDDTGARVSARTDDRLLRVRALPLADGLVLEAPGRSPLKVRVPDDGPAVPVTISRVTTLRDAGTEAAAWLSSFLGRTVRLGWQESPRDRPVSAAHGGRGDDVVSLADTAPLLLTSTASLDQLNRWMEEEQEIPEHVTSRRFRPNVVVTGDLVPFAEDRWMTVVIGDIPFRFTEHCDRCALTLIDPDTLGHGKEPIRTLARHRRWDGKTWFGIRIVPLATGTLRVGDPVRVDAETAFVPAPV